MRPDKEIKKWFKLEAAKNPEKYYAFSVLTSRGFERRACKHCGTNFWSVNKDQDHCGDSSCAGGFTLFKDNPAKHQMSYAQVWQEFSKMFHQKGYAVVPRYPVVARWNPTMDFTIASIAAFQPHVVSGEVEPPAKKLVIPQFCLRFGDVDNVGVTMSHMTGFVMIGQKTFVPKEEWNQAQLFTDIFDWLTQGLGLPYEEITFHEDAWAGGGNFGPCMEFFSRGVELGNQVYMMFEQDDSSPGGFKELKLKVLDMGMGHERNAWFSQGRGTIYDATFPHVIQKLKDRTHVNYDLALVERYTPFAAFLNLDEVEDIDKAWQRVAKEMKMPVEQVRAGIEPMTAIYSIAEHARSLLFALSDGALPSNVGGGYNLRIVFRRAQSFIDKFEWDVDMGEVARWHADELKPLFPDLAANLKDVEKILAVELEKYRENKKRAQSVIEQIFKSKKDVTPELLAQLYDSQGIQPEQVAQEARRLALAYPEANIPQVKVPENFYALVTARQEKTQQEQRTQTRKIVKLPLDEVPKTAILYYDSYDYVRFESPIVKVLEQDKVVLERSAFYPTSGGQEHDIGTLNGIPVVDVIKQDGVIVHVLAEPVHWKKGDIAQGEIDIERRQQLAQHHTATHIINGAARRVLGNHVWQAGAAKTKEKARIDITHYDALSDEELKAIEAEANKVVHQNLPVYKMIKPKNLAEAEFGFRLYQGGAVPGKDIRVVDIPGFDVEACGGTHLNTTGEAGTIRILGSRKVQDGIVRIEYVAGPAAVARSQEQGKGLEELEQLLGVKAELIPAKAELTFKIWKEFRKAVKANKPVDVTDLEKQKLAPFSGDVVTEAGRRLQTQDVPATLKRFLKEIDEMKAKLPK